jgi:hypothetical protein
LPIAFELILPIAVNPDEPAPYTSASEVKPSYILAAVVQQDADSDLELLAATWAGALAQLAIGEKLVAVADGVLIEASGADPHCRPS